MRVIEFKKNSYKDTTTTYEKPVVNIIRVVFNTDDDDWVHRLFTASLKLKATTKNQEVSEKIVLGAYITPNHRQPVLDINTIEYFRNDTTPSFVEIKDTYWECTIELEKLELKENETLNVSIIERKHIQKRVQDWKKRIEDLYTEINNWLVGQTEYSCKIGRSTVMFEDLMRTFEISQQNLDTLDVYYKEKIIFTFKPKGLWTIAANGRIDILSGKGSFMLVDFSEHFQKPLWHIYTTDKKTKSSFDKDVFQEIISFITKI